MTGIERIAAERQRQIDVEGWTPEHDANHESGTLSAAAQCYTLWAMWQILGGSEEASRQISALWPFAPKCWKPSEDPARNLEKAGALIAAELDRLENTKGR